MNNVPEYDEFVVCQRPDCLHDNAKALTGLYGLLGGGMGPYTVCGKCGDLLTKSQDQEMLCESHATEIKDAVESPEAPPAAEHDE